MRGVTRVGPRDAPKVLLLHGGVINRQMWLPVMEQLDDAFDCIATDLPGHGTLSDQSFTVDSSVAHAIDVLDRNDIEEVVVVGLSLGGYIAQALTAKHGDRVAGLVLSGATIRYTGWDGLATRLYGLAFPFLARAAGRAFARQLEGDLGEAVAGPILDAGISMRGGGQALRRLPGHDYALEMGRFTGPIVIANGERDSSNRKAEDLFRQHHPAATSIVIKDAGHACALQQPEAFAATVAKAVHASSKS